MYQVLDLFSGIGGFSLGLERTGGFKTVAFCEIEEFPRKVLAKHWPDVPIYRDVRELTGEQLRADGIAVDVVCGGFPCQDISTAGKGAGIDGARSGLWSEYARLVGEIRPRYVIVENVAALLGRGLGRVLGDLAALGYDAEWHCIPASAVGAPHRRDRLWIVAYPAGERFQRGGVSANGDGRCQPNGWADEPSGNGAAHRTSHVAHAKGKSSWARLCETEAVINGDIACYSGGALADANEPRLERWIRKSLSECSGEQPTWQEGSRWIGETWFAEPDVGRVAHGVPARVDRLKGLGNAVVPQIPELIGRAILEAA